jgi:glycosyltransferase involved in cell wall biosynthesis
MTPATEHPFVSIIVPVYNDRGRIGACIEALLRQKWPADRREILIVDNNSTDGTRDIIAKYPVRLLVEKDRQSSYAARNLGLREAKGEIIAFTDSDARAHANWLTVGIARMERDRIDYLSCRVKMFFGHGASPTLLDMVDYHFAFDNEVDMKFSHSTPTVALITRRSVIEKVGGFSEELISGGDVEFGDRVWRAGFRQAYEPHAIVYHPCRSKPRAFFKRTWRYGRGRLVLSRRFPERFGTPLGHLLTPGTYLPPHPLRFAKRIRRRFRFPARAVAGILALYYLNRLCYQGAKWWALVTGAR